MAVGGIWRIVTRQPLVRIGTRGSKLALTQSGMMQRAIAARPDLAKAHLHMGDALSFQNRFAEAVASYQSAVGLKPDYAQAYSNFGNALLQLGEKIDSPGG